MTKERRKCTRVLFKNSCTLIGQNGRFPASLVDICLKGALIDPGESSVFVPNEDCELEIVLGTPALQLNIQARMVHSDGRRIGMKFTHIDIDSLTHLRKLIELNVGDAELTTKELSVWSGDTDR